jgi:hypothetical protein
MALPDSSVAGVKNFDRCIDKYRYKLNNYCARDADGTPETSASQVAVEDFLWLTDN